ncbi:Neuropeptide F receptor [Aphelenchoides besseyi]|nr:Neuropeptide F receptor [Aphelenchoides besseyi]
MTEQSSTSSFWSFFRNESNLEINYFNLHQVLENRPAFQQIGLSVCQYLNKIRDIQDGFNYQEDGIGATMAAYLGTSAFGLFTNLFTLVILYHATNLKRPRNYLIASHILTDCLQCANAPVNLLMIFHLFWGFDDFACKMASFFKASTFYASYLTLSVLAAHQYISYRFKFNSHWFTLIFLISSFLAAPYVLSISVEVVNYFEPWDDVEHLNKALVECNMTRPTICTESGWDRVPFISQEAYLIVTLVLLYVLPLFGLLLSYYACRQMKKDPALLPAYCGTPMKNRENFMMLAFLVFVFLLHWLPMTLFTFLHLFEIVEFSYSRYLICQTIGVSTSIIKPIIYGLTNKDIRAMYQDTIRSMLCPCGICARPQRHHIRRLIRMGFGLTEIPQTEEEDDEVFERVARYKRQKQRRYRAVTVTSGSLVDRRLIHSSYPPRRSHCSLR